MADQAYRKLLQERLSESPSPEPARKRRRGGPKSQDSRPPLDDYREDAISATNTTNSPENNHSDDSFDSDDFEDVVVDNFNENYPLDASQDLIYDLNQTNEPIADSFTVTLAAPEAAKTGSSRKRAPTASKEERSRRRAVHRLYLAAMLAHGAIRNRWCNDYRLQTRLRKLVSPQTRLLLDPDEKLASMVRSRRFLDGICQLMEVYSARFRVTAKGLIRKNWAQMAVKQTKTESNMTFSKFVSLAEGLYGSRDLGAQGFVALLRLVGLQARLVFSLQPPDHTAITEVQKVDEVPEPSEPPKDRVRGSARMRLLARMRAQPVVSTKETEPAADSEYPIFWAEVWNKHSSKWIAVDPIVLKTIEDVPLRRKSKFEPPTTDTTNQLYYAIAYDRLGGVKDVTRRYSHFYNARTVKKRITARSEEDSFWYNRLIRACCSTLRRGKTNRLDAVELKEFYKRDLAEGIPNNIGDFKNHPLYVLESQLRQNEIIYPKDDSSKCGTYRKKTTGNKEQPVVPIYKRSSVVQLRSAKAWYMRGRVLKMGAQPLKTKKRTILTEEDDEDVALYGEFQTQLYIPPPIEDGKVPKNAYGNIDIYVPTMMPENGFLVDVNKYAMKLQERAARIILVDYAKAIVAFDFGGKDGKKASRMPTAREGGILIAVQYKEAMLAVLECLAEEEEEAKRAAAELDSLRNWKFFLTKLRITDRLNKHHGEIEKKAKKKTKQRKRKSFLDSESDFEEEDDSDFSVALSDGFEEGGFVAGDHVMENEEEYMGDQQGKEDLGIMQKEGGLESFPSEEGGFLQEGGFANDEEGGGFVNEEEEEGFVNEEEEGGFVNEEGGGFVIEEEEEEEGGFVNEDGGRVNENEGGFLNQSDQYHASNQEYSNQQLDDELEKLPDDFFRQNEHGEWIYDPPKDDSSENEEENGEKAVSELHIERATTPESPFTTKGDLDEVPDLVAGAERGPIAAKTGISGQNLAQKGSYTAEIQPQPRENHQESEKQSHGPSPAPQAFPEPPSLETSIQKAHLQDNSSRSSSFDNTRTPLSQEDAILLDGSIAEYEADVMAEEDQLGFEYELE